MHDTIWNATVAQYARAWRDYHRAEAAGQEELAERRWDEAQAAQAALWAETPPDLRALAEKLDLALSWLSEPAPPLERVLADLRAFATRNRKMERAA